MPPVLDPARCVPPDFINPFPGGIATAIACTIVLGAECISLLVISSDHTRVRMLRLLAGLTLVAALGALALALWIWPHSTGFVIWCTPNPGVIRVQAAALQRMQSLGTIAIGVTSVLALAGFALALATRRAGGPREERMVA